MEVIGLLGIGLVGTALAEHLLRAGFGVVGFDPVAEKRAGLEALGGRAASGPKEVAAQVDRVVLSLLDTEVVCRVVEGRGGILEARNLPGVIVDTTTGDPDQTAALAARLAARGIQFLDATISGSSQQIRRREAVFMAGGELRAFQRCRDLLEACAERVFYLGPAGSGSRAKLANNLILGLNRLVLAEGLCFAEALGLELKSFLELCKASPAYSCAMDVKGEKMIRGDFRPESRVRQHAKDLAIILDYASRLGQPLHLAEIHAELLARAITGGRGDLDTSAVLLELKAERPAGIRTEEGA